MFRLFGGKKLLEWEIAKPDYGGRFAHHPFWVRVALSMIFCCGLESLVLVVLAGLMGFFRFGLTIFSFEVLMTILKVSFGIGIPLGMISSVFFMAPYLLKDRVIIWDKGISSRLAGKEQRLKFKKFDRYAFRQSDGVADAKFKRMLVLVNSKKQDGFGITLPSKISEEMIDEVLQGRLIRDDMYGVE